MYTINNFYYAFFFAFRIRKYIYTCNAKPNRIESSRKIKSKRQNYGYSVGGSLVLFLYTLIYIDLPLHILIHAYIYIYRFIYKLIQ